MSRYLIVTLALAALVAVGVQASATQNRENDAMSVTQAKIPMTQAVSAAEQHAGGKASRAEYEHTKSGWAYDVEVVNGSDVYDVRVDASTGAVLSSAKDKVDHDDQGDHDD